MSLDNDIGFQEWKSCQESLREFDKILVDLRKYGFGLITILLSANGFLFARTDIGDIAIMGILAAILVLIFGLFRFDRVHEVFVRAAVLRAIHLEQSLSMGLTWEITYWSEKLATGTWGHYLYVFFCFAAYLLAVAGIVHSPGTTPGGVPEAVLVLVCALFGGVAGFSIFRHHADAKHLQPAFRECSVAYAAVRRYQAPGLAGTRAEAQKRYATLLLLFVVTPLLIAHFLTGWSGRSTPNPLWPS